MAKRRKYPKKRRTGRKMTTGECRTTRRGVEYCKTAHGVRFTGRMSDIADIGDPGRMSPGECKNIQVRGGTRQICYTSQGVRFVPMHDIAELAALRRSHKKRRR